RGGAPHFLSLDRRRGQQRDHRSKRHQRFHGSFLSSSVCRRCAPQAATNRMESDFWRPCYCSDGLTNRQWALLCGIHRLISIAATINGILTEPQYHVETLE